MKTERNHTIFYIKNLLISLLVLGIIAEMFFFPTLQNLYGCIMALISLMLFLFFFKIKYIKYYPFAFCMYLSMFLYRYLPLFATLLEGKPITYGFERAYDTFIYEIILFLISSLSFYLACYKTKLNSNNLFQKILFKVKFFETTPQILWGMGVLGITVHLYNLSTGAVEYGDVGGKFLIGLEYLMFAPLCMFFPSLLKLKFSHKRILWSYTILIFIISIASNKRHLIITPFGVISLLFLLFLIINNKKLTSIISAQKLVLIVALLVVLISFLSNVSLAMLYTRETMLYNQDLRNNADKLESFNATIETLQNEALMEDLHNLKDRIQIQQTKYAQGWTEDYVENFMLARYANMRITDETLYYAEKKGFANRQMQEALKVSLITLFPTPILNFFNTYVDKKDLEYSRGDLLYGSGFGGYRVTSHVGDGLATFGYWYFPLQFIVFFIIFKLLNSFIFIKSDQLIYAPFALMGIFTFLGRFRNANGITGDLSYILRGFIQGIVTYLFIYYAIRFLISLFNPKYLK